MIPRGVEASLWFCAGAAMQARWLLRGRLSRMEARLLAGIAILSFAFSGGGLSPVGSLFMLGIFAFFFTIAFRGRILPFFNEQSALFYSILFIYALACVGAEGHPPALMASKAALLPALALMAACFFGWQPEPRPLYCLYAWFTFAALGLGATGLFFGGGLRLLLEGELCAACRLKLLFTGMGGMFLAVAGVLFLLLLGFEADGRSRLGRRRQFSSAEDWKAGIAAMQQHYLKRKLGRPWLLALILAEGLALDLNYIEGWLSPPAMVTATALLLPAGLGALEAWARIKPQKNPPP